MHQRLNVQFILNKQKTKSKNFSSQTALFPESEREKVLK